MVEWFPRWLEAAAMMLESAAAAVILAGAVVAGATWLRRRDAVVARGQLTHALLFALDLTIGADVLKVALAPDVPAAAAVGLVVLVRIVLTAILLVELRLERPRP
jgi:uncharacterized membrane protein